MISKVIEKITVNINFYVTIMINNLIKIKYISNFYLEKKANKTKLKLIKIKNCFNEKNMRFENWSMYW